MQIDTYGGMTIIDVVNDSIIWNQCPSMTTGCLICWQCRTVMTEIRDLGMLTVTLWTCTNCYPKAIRISVINMICWPHGLLGISRYVYQWWSCLESRLVGDVASISTAILLHSSAINVVVTWVNHDQPLLIQTCSLIIWACRISCGVICVFCGGMLLDSNWWWRGVL